MAEAALQLKIEQAEAAVVKADDAVAKAQGAFDGAVGDDRTLCGQLLLAKENVLLAVEHALAQLRDKELIQQRASTGSCCLHFTVYRKHSVEPLKTFGLVCGLGLCCSLTRSQSSYHISFF